MGHIKPLTEEESSSQRVPGQMVHEAMFAQFDKMLGTFETLLKVTKDGKLENPTISNLVAGNVRVIYFWEGQQVLCLDPASCKGTPGYLKGPLGFPLSFGEPQALGTRTMEPGCILFNDDLMRSSIPKSIVTAVKRFASTPKDFA